RRMRSTRFRQSPKPACSSLRRTRPRWCAASCSTVQTVLTGTMGLKNFGRGRSRQKAERTMPINNLDDVADVVARTDVSAMAKFLHFYSDLVRRKLPPAQQQQAWQMIVAAFD